MKKLQTKILGSIIVIVIGGLGVYSLIGSHAATPSTIISAVTGNVAGGADPGNCSGSSSGSCVTFRGYGLPPAIYHNIGAYQIYSAASAQAAAQAGISTALILGNPARSALLGQAGLKYLDQGPSSLIYSTYKTDCGTTNPTCVLTTTQNQALDAQIQQQVVANRNDPNLAGYYILDDSLGNIHDTLIGVNNVIKQYGVTANGTVLPTFCVFGGFLDYKVNPGDPSFTTNHSFFDSQITNYSPQACDNTMLYIYAAAPYPSVSVGDANYDWRMSNLLPYELGQLQARGWNGNTGGLTAVPDTFGDGTENLFPTPSTSAVATQVSAFCNAGFGAIMSFLWDPLPFSGAESLGNDPALLNGLKTGATTCHQRWGS